MKVKVQIVVEHEDLDEPIVEEIACLCRGDLLPETLGLTLVEGKQFLAKIQEQMVSHQAAEYVARQRSCPECGRRRANKGKHQIVWRSVFGKLCIESPRLYTCSCQPQPQQSISPLAELLPDRTAPELGYLQSKWASLMSYGLTVDLIDGGSVGRDPTPADERCHRLFKLTSGGRAPGRGTGRGAGDVR